MWHLNLKCSVTESEHLSFLTKDKCVKILSEQHQSKYPVPGDAADFKNSAGNGFQPSNKQITLICLQTED